MRWRAGRPQHRAEGQHQSQAKAITLHLPLALLVGYPPWACLADRPTVWSYHGRGAGSRSLSLGPCKMGTQH